MRAWPVMLGGLTVWAAHFAVLYAIASALPGEAAARWLVLVTTLPAIALDLLILWRTADTGRPDELDGWIAWLGGAGAAISLVAVVWQSLPAVLA